MATGTMMGFPCLHVAGAFFASCYHRTGDLVVMLPRDHVAQLIADGAGKPFTPAGRTFREWVLIDEDRTFVSGNTDAPRRPHEPNRDVERR